MDNFSMKLDLSNFFKDERRQSLVFIDANWQNIKDVQDHIQNLFKLKDINLLTTDGCFLPPRESIQVLVGAPGLKAFRFKDPEENDFASPAPVTSKPSKKRKYTSAEEEVELPSSTPSRPSKRSKKKSSIVPEIPPATSPDLSIAPFEFPLRSSQNSTKYDESNVEPPPSVSSKTECHSITKSSRTLRNESLVASEPEDSAIPEEETASQTEISARQPIVFRCPLMELDSNTKRTFELPVKKKKIVIIENIEIKAANGFHLEPVATKQPEETAAEAEPLEAGEEASELSKAEPKADSEEPKETGDNLTNATEAETSQAEEKFEPKDMVQPSVEPPPPVRICAESLSSDSDDDVMVLDDTNADDSDSDVQAVAPTEETRPSAIIRDMMQSSIPLTETPSRGDSILFQLSKVKGNPSLGSTDFIAGNCTYVNRRSKVITLEVISCPSEFQRILRQYTSSLDDSSDEVRCLNVSIKDLRNTRIIVDTID
ncbi:hypothetical protein KR054_003648 [Drosophila jambulina]|nr:hypothetical protein KR054_003648 [Drosophila jambulina]